MPYDVSKNAKGRWVVTSPAGKVWKSTYPSRGAAMKGVDYVQSRFTAGPKAEVTTDSSGMETEPRGAKTVKALRAREEAW